MLRQLPIALTAALLPLPTLAEAHAQCTPQWIVSSGLGVDGVVHEALEWDPDGIGPLPPLVVVAGEFDAAGGLAAPNLAFYEPIAGTWSAAGAGTNGLVRALAVDANGHLIIGGDFTTVDGVARPGIARWDGTAWHDLGTGIDVSRTGVHALLTLGSALVVGGDFDFAGAAPANNIALWDGAAWSALGNGLTHTAGSSFSNEATGVRDLVVDASNIVAVGCFDRSGTTVLNSVAVLQANSWQAIGSFAGSFFGAPLVRDAATMVNGDVYVVGTDWFGQFVRRWNQATWTDVPGFNNRPYSVTTTAAGEVVIGGVPVFFGTSEVQRLTGTSWTTIATAWDAGAFPTVHCLTELPSLSHRLLIAGEISGIDGTAVSGMTIQQPGGGWLGDEGRFTYAPVLFAGPEGELLASQGTYYGSSQIDGLARWNGSTFVQVPGAPASVGDVAFDHRGGFAVKAGTSVYYWQAGVWTSLGMPLGNAYNLTISTDGEVFAANPTFQRWTGVSWQNLNQSTTGGDCAAMPDGRVAVTNPAGWGGSQPRVWIYTPNVTSGQWQALGSAADLDAHVRALAVTPQGEVIVGGDFSFGNRVARWDGSSWQPMGAGFDATVEQLQVSADGRVLARGLFTASGAVLCPGNAIWDGTSWAPLASSNQQLVSAVAHADGDFWASTLKGRLARLQTPCPANVGTVNPGCDQLRLLSSAWPMLGGLHRAFGSGLPSDSLVISVFGTSSTTVPLSSLLPYGQAGCELAVLPDALGLSLPIGDHVQLELAVPNASALIGATFFEQLVTIELDPSAVPFRARSSNSLSLTIGSNH